MLAIVWIAVIAVAGVILLLILGFLTHGLISRRRHRQYMRQSEQDLRVYHRPRLSARASNYADIVRPPSFTGRQTETQQVKPTWEATLQTQELVAPEAAPATQPDHSPTPPKGKRKLRDSIYGHSGTHAPKTRRQKKIDKTISLKDMNRSPLSAITELTDSTANELPMPVELPTDRIPHIIPEKETDVSPIHGTTKWSLPAQKKRPDHLSPIEIDTPLSLKHDASFTQTAELPVSPGRSMSEAPDSPLPPLPTFQASGKLSGANRSSQLSTMTVGSSVLGASSPSDLSLAHTVNSGMQEFNFGFNRGAEARVGPSPGRQTGWHSGGRDVNSVVPMFDFNGTQRSTMSTSQTQGVKDPPVTDDSTGWVPNADFFFGAPQPDAPPAEQQLRPRSGRELLREHRQMIGSVSPTGLPPRPASIASSQPSRLDQPPTFARSRLSVNSIGSGRRPRGHRRQNCVRIQIPVVPAIPVSPIARPVIRARRPSHISEAAEDSDGESSPLPKKVQVVEDVSAAMSPVSPMSPASRKHLSTRRSIVDANGSPSASPLTRRGTLRSSGGVANPTNAVPSPSSDDSGSPRPDSDVFWSHQGESPPKSDPFAYPDRWALLPTPTHYGSSRMSVMEPPHQLSVFEQPNSEEEEEEVSDSPVLPSPCKPIAPAAPAANTTRPRTLSRPLGPRQAPAFPSTNIHLQRSPSKSSPSTSRAGSPTRLTSLIQTTSTASSENNRPVQSVRQSAAQLRSSGTVSHRRSSTVGALNPNAGTQNYEAWKQLNALWEVSRSNSVNSLSTRATPAMLALTGTNSTHSNSGNGGGGVPWQGNNMPYSTAASGLGGRVAGVGRASIFGSSKRKMSLSHSSNYTQSPDLPGSSTFSNTTTTIPPLAANRNSQQHRRRASVARSSVSVSPQRRSSLYSVDEVSIWEDESIRGDSPEPNSRRASLAVRVPPPRLESLRQRPFELDGQQQQQGQAQGQVQADGSGSHSKPKGLGITIPPLKAATLDNHSAPPLGPSPTQKQLKARYFGSNDWDKEGNSTVGALHTSSLIFPSAAAVGVIGGERKRPQTQIGKENVNVHLLSLSPSSLSPVSAVGSPVSGFRQYQQQQQVRSLAMTSNRNDSPSLQRELDLTRDRDHERQRAVPYGARPPLGVSSYSAPPAAAAPRQSQIQNQSQAHTQATDSRQQDQRVQSSQQYGAYYFPLPGSGGARRPSASHSLQQQPQQQQRDSGYVGGSINSPLTAASSVFSPHTSLSAGTATSSSSTAATVGLGLGIDGAIVGPTGAAGVGAPQQQQQQQKRKVSPAQERLKEALRKRAAGLASAAGRVQGGQGGRASVASTRSGMVTSPDGVGRAAIDGGRATEMHSGGGGGGNGGNGSDESRRRTAPGGGLRELPRDLWSTSTPSPSSPHAPALGGDVAGGGGGGAGGVPGSAKTLKSLYDAEGFLKDSPLRERGSGVAATAAATGLAGNGAGTVGGGGGGGLGRSYRRMQ